MGLTFDRLQEEVGAWAGRNFPGSTDNESFHGVVEEIGELADALIRHQEALDKCDGDAEDEALDALGDAIGDATVFLADYAGRRGISISSVLAELGLPFATLSQFQDEVSMGADTLDDPVLRLTAAIGDLAHARLKMRQGIRAATAIQLAAERGAVGRIAIWLSVLCSREGLDYGVAVDQTWAEVSKRDWVANPETGRAPQQDAGGEPPIVLPKAVEKAIDENAARGGGYPILDAKTYLRGEFNLKTTPAEPEVYPADTSIPTRSTMPYEV